MGRHQNRHLLPGLENPMAFALASRDSSVLSVVDQAVRNNQVVLAFQSIVPAGDQSEPALYEGFVRVLDATGRIIPARDFIHSIEDMETGRIVDCLALEQGLQCLRNYPNVRLAINMSARSIGYPRWMRSLKRGLSKDATIAERLILDITESSAMLIPEIAVGFMEDLRRQGISFALDDFGAGFTSFRHLKDLYFDIVKIDGQFVRGVSENVDNQVMMQALVAFAKELDMLTVAESVENADDAEVLRHIGVDCLQGYYFGAPTMDPPWQHTSKKPAKAG